MKPVRRGAALLEVMIALTLLLGAGVGFVTVLGASLQSEAAMRTREREYEEMGRLLTALSLLSRGDLDRRLGRHTIGGLTSDVQRPERTLYRVEVGANGPGQRESLVTVVYRPDEGTR